MPAPDGGPPGKMGGASKIFRNASALLSGKAAGGVLSLAYLAIAARALGPKDMGYLAIASAYALTVAGLVRFQSWQAIIRFGTPMVEAGGGDDLRALLRYTIRLDFFSAAAGVLIALAFVGVAARVLDWPDEALPLLFLYCFAVPFVIAATPTGILRLFDRFKLLGWQMLASPVIRFVGAIAALASGAGLAVFVAIWMFSSVFDGVVVWWLGWRELKRRGLAPKLFGRAAGPAPRAWLDFMLKSNATSIFDMARNGLPTLIVGGALGSAASGYLQLATNLTNLIAHPSNMLSHATLPELTKIAVGDGRRKMLGVALRTMGIGLAAAAPLVIAFALLSKTMVTLVGGADFAPAAIVLALMAAAQLPRISSIVLESASLSIGRAGLAMAAQGVSAFAQIASLFLLMPHFGAAAAPMSLVLGYLVMIAVHFFRLRRAAPG
ncbi:MAG TPA: hypothetical protein DDZ68_04335 [Parvularcula sp.]|nr:hypothetical protein [Parvularcula sp.]HBS32654.1 hypothetical protein [Parvularcula sp.]HBS36028.1 hypothetical protein [Parvularcula sp.]